MNPEKINAGRQFKIATLYLLQELEPALRKPASRKGRSPMLLCDTKYLTINFASTTLIPTMAGPRQHRFRRPHSAARPLPARVSPDPAAVAPDPAADLRFIRDTME